MWTYKYMVILLFYDKKVFWLGYYSEWYNYYVAYISAVEFWIIRI